VVDPGRPGARGQGIAEQQAAAAPHLQHVIAGPGRERVQDRPPGEVVHILGTVDLARPAPARPPGHPVGEPAGKRVLGQPAIVPRRDILITQPEPAQRLLSVARLHLRHISPFLAVSRRRSGHPEGASRKGPAGQRRAGLP